MRSWHVPGERVITLMSAGNLATTQAVVSLLDERTKAPQDRHPSILSAPSMFQVAMTIGETLRGIVMRHGDEGPMAEWIFRASLIVGGQIKGRSEEHTSELQSLMRISSAVFCLQKKKHTKT